MTSTEAMIYQLKKLKGKPLKQKVQHILTYFWIPILAIVVILGSAVSYIVHLATVKEQVLSVVCINAVAEQQKKDTFAREFLENEGIDTKENEVWLSTDIMISANDPMSSYDAAQYLVTWIATQSVDVMAGDIETMTQYFYQGFMADLTEILTPEQQEAYGEYFLYMDMAVFEQKENDPEAALVYPDPANPETMERPVPVALWLPEDGAFTELCYARAADRAAISVVVNSPNIANALAFVDYIMG